MSYDTKYNVLRTIYTPFMVLSVISYLELHNAISFGIDFVVLINEGKLGGLTL